MILQPQSKLLSYLHLQTHLQFIITKFLLFLTLKLRLTLKHTKFSHKNLHTHLQTHNSIHYQLMRSLAQNQIFIFYMTFCGLHTPTNILTHTYTLEGCIIVYILSLCIISCFICFILRFSMHVFLRM